MSGKRKMPLLLGIIVTVFSSCKVSGLTLSVQTNYFEISGSAVTLECNLDGTAWNANSARLWKVPPNTMTVIDGGSANPGYTEDLSDAATGGIFRMTTPPLNWSIENQLFQCVYSFDTADLNATRDTLARNSGGSASYDESAKKCVFTISEILPSPTKVVTHVQSGSGELDISSDSRVKETLSDNNDQEQTYSYRIEVDGSNMQDGDQVKFQVTAGPFTENETCDIKKETSTVHGTSPVNLGTTETSEEAQNLSTLTTEFTPSSSESITSEANTTTSSQFTVSTDIVSTTRRDLDVDDLLLATVVSSVVGGIILIVIVAFVLYFLIKKIRGSSRKETPHAPEMEGFDNKGMKQDRYLNKHKKGKNGLDSNTKGIGNYRPKSLGTSYSTPYVDNGNPRRSKSEIGNDGYVQSSGRMYPSLPYAAYYSKHNDVAAIHTRNMRYNDRYLQHSHL